MINSEFLRLDTKDIAKGLVSAVLAGFLLPIVVALQTPDFSIFHADWAGLLNVALKGAETGFATYLLKNLFSNSEGKFLGKIG